MLKKIQHKQKMIFVLGVLLAFVKPSFAFEEFGEIRKQCQSTCHQAEHIKKSRQDKLSKPECRSCHVGINYVSPTTRKPIQDGLLIKSLIQTNVSATKNTKAEQVSSSPLTEMALIPKGEFVMGSNERWDDEAPEHISSTNAFHMDLNEVTNLAILLLIYDLFLILNIVSNQTTMC